MLILNIRAVTKKNDSWHTPFCVSIIFPLISVPRPHVNPRLNFCWGETLKRGGRVAFSGLKATTSMWVLYSSPVVRVIYVILPHVASSLFRSRFEILEWWLKAWKTTKSSWEVQASIQHHFAKMMVVDFQANQFQKIHVNPKWIRTPLDRWIWRVFQTATKWY